MSKTLVAILQYNTFELTDNLFETLKPFESDIYDLIVVDNGSQKDKVSKYTTHAIEQNCYYGGGVNAILGLFLEDDRYDSVQILNNDLQCHGDGWVGTLKLEMLKGKYDLISPCILEPHSGPQAFWKCMRPWHTKGTRDVPFIDYQAPMFSRRLAEKMFPIPEKLVVGWGLDIMSSMICEDEGWKMGVCDSVPVIHLVSQTLILNPETQSNTNSLAERNMFEHYQETKQFDRFIDIRNRTASYTI